MRDDEIKEILQTEITQGLSEAEAAARLGKYGENRLAEGKKKGIILRFLEQFKDVMILILLAAAVVSFVLAFVDGGADLIELIEPVLILGVVIANAIMGVVQENKAERALEALKKMSAPNARVIREGKLKIIPASALVPGDVIRLDTGDYVPADAKLVESSALKCEESALTGESVAAEKDAAAEVAENAPIAERANEVFSGTYVTYGTGAAIVTHTGMATQMGKIAGLLSGEKQEATPLQKKLGKLGKYLGIAALIVCAVIFAVGMINGQEPMELFMTAVSLAVAAIPEGLPAVVTVVLAVGVQRMAKKNAVIRRLPAVETLGSASVICSDKTGTLTQNRMTLVRAYADGGTEEEIGDHNGEEVRRLLMLGTLCSEGSVERSEEGETHIGDPTETSIVSAALKNGMEKAELYLRYPRTATLPFDSDRKLMTSVHRMDGKRVAIVKGAFDSIAARAVSGDLAAAEEKCAEMSASALRVLAVAAKELKDDEPQSEWENGLTFLGLLGMIDPPRPEAREAVARCREAGIRPVMITGDSLVTASAIAKDLGIMREGDEALLGTEVDAMSAEELAGRVDKVSVYARVSPENKISIVKAWQSRGEIVAMTGDGVNDAPALKAADIGCAMGITGTDVAKGAADMTLSDDNFATIVDAVEEGRGIYANIRKVVGFLLGTNIGELLLVFAAMLIWGVSPLISIQLLWINLVSDGFPAIALGLDGGDPSLMKRPPKRRNEGIFSGGYLYEILFQGFIFGGISLAAYYLGRTMCGTESAGQTLAFLVFAVAKLLQAYHMRTERSIFLSRPFSNRSLNYATLLSLALTLAVALIPGVRSVFGFSLLSWQAYLAGLGLVLVPTVTTECYKAIRAAIRARRGARE